MEPIDEESAYLREHGFEYEDDEAGRWIAEMDREDREFARKVDEEARKRRQEVPLTGRR